MVFTRQRPGRESNLASAIRKSDALPVSHRATQSAAENKHMVIQSLSQQLSAVLRSKKGDVATAVGCSEIHEIEPSWTYTMAITEKAGKCSQELETCI